MTSALTYCEERLLKCLRKGPDTFTNIRWAIEWVTDCFQAQTGHKVPQPLNIGLRNTARQARRQANDSERCLYGVKVDTFFLNLSHFCTFWFHTPVCITAVTERAWRLVSVQHWTDLGASVWSSVCAVHKQSQPSPHLQVRNSVKMLPSTIEPNPRKNTTWDRGENVARFSRCREV